MKYLSVVPVIAREVPRGWQIVFGDVPHRRAWIAAYFVAGFGGLLQLEAFPHLSAGYMGWCAGSGLTCGALAIAILIGLRHAALRRGRARYDAPTASMGDLWRYANEERAALLVSLLRRHCDVGDAARWVQEQFRRTSESRLALPNWLISFFLLPIAAGMTLAVTTLGWKGVIVGISLGAIVLALWLVATRMSLMTLEPLHDLAHLLNLASIRGPAPELATVCTDNALAAGSHPARS